MASTVLAAQSRAAVIAESSSQQAAEISVLELRVGTVAEPLFKPEVDLLVALKGSEEERLILDDRTAQAEAVVPRSPLALTLPQAVMVQVLASSSR